MIQRRRSNGDSGREAVRILKRRLSDAVFQALRTDQRELTTRAHNSGSFTEEQATVPSESLGVV
jgi:hypothetical protein